MFQVLTVCTGNICRSPLAEVLLRTRLHDLDGAYASAGTRGLSDVAMTAETQRLAAQLGATDDAIRAHRSRFLTERMLTEPDLILTMTRDHRRQVAELAPTRLRSTFTVREFGRLAHGLTDDEVARAADAAPTPTDASSRLRSAVSAVAARRGAVDPPASPADDDVVDPYRRSWKVYLDAHAQMAPGLDEVERVVRAAVGSANGV